MKPVDLTKHPRVTAAKRECLAVLSDVRHQVKAGEIESIAVVMITRDGRALIERTEVKRPDALLGGTVRLQHDVLGAFEETEAADG